MQFNGLGSLNCILQEIAVQGKVYLEEAFDILYRREPYVHVRVKNVQLRFPTISQEFVGNVSVNLSEKITPLYNENNMVLIT